MKEMIFIDSTAFLALNNPDDLHHEVAVDWVKSMLGETVGLSTCMSVIGETATGLKKLENDKKDSFQKVENFLNLIRKPGIQILQSNPDVQTEGWKLFLRTEKMAQITFADCLKVACMHYYGIMKIFTFNEDFDKLEVVRIPKK